MPLKDLVAELRVSNLSKLEPKWSGRVERSKAMCRNVGPKDRVMLAA